MSKMNAGWRAALILGAFSFAGCGALSGAVDTATATVSEALNTSSNASDAPESAGLLRGPKELRSEAAEGFRCDASPDITYVDVCGQSLPATVHLEWTNCAAPERGGQRGDGGVGGPECDGGQPPVLADGGVPPQREGRGGPGGGRGGHGGGEGHGPSSGVADITYTYSTPDGCTGAVVRDESASFSITRTAPDGSTAESVGTTTGEAQLVTDGKPLQKALQVDVTRTRKDSAGAVTDSVHLVGSTTVAFSSDTPPTRTINGSFTETHADGSTGTTTQTDVVRPPMDVCAWPISGTLARTSSNGDSHTLVYGPDCGSATLDGTVIDLSVRPERQHGGH